MIPAVFFVLFVFFVVRAAVVFVMREINNMKPIALLAASLAAVVGGMTQAQTGLPLDVAVQYRAPVESSAGYKNLEVYLSNTGAVPVVFTNVAWETAAESDVAWQQFYPGPEVGPGETILFQVNFRKAPAKAQTVRLFPAYGQSLAIKIPAWKQPEKQITGISYSRDLRGIFLQYQSASAGTADRSRKVKPVRVWVDGVEITDFRILRSAEKETPDVAVLKSPKVLKTGMPLHVAVLFQDGVKQAVLVRVLDGIVLDAYCLTSDQDRPLLGLDAKPSVAPIKCVMGGDVACYDVKKGQHGAAAEEVIAERLKSYAAGEERLQAIHYCTARFGQMWDLYGKIADAVYVNPYCLSYSHDVSRWLDEELDCMRKAGLAARPRPWLWIPDCFRRGARFIEPVELEILAWTALAQGCKGINYFAYKFQNDRGFADSPKLLKAVKRLNAEIRANAERLVPLLPVSEETQGSDENAIKVYTAWSGDAGMLAVVRNMDYRTDGATNDVSPRFSARKRSNVEVVLQAPEWLDCKTARDFKTGRKLPFKREGGNLTVHLKALDAYRVLWLGHWDSPVRWYQFWRERKPLIGAN